METKVVALIDKDTSDKIYTNSMDFTRDIKTNSMSSLIRQIKYGDVRHVKLTINDCLSFLNYRDHRGNLLFLPKYVSLELEQIDIKRLSSLGWIDFKKIDMGKKINNALIQVIFRSHLFNNTRQLELLYTNKDYSRIELSPLHLLAIVRLPKLITVSIDYAMQAIFGDFRGIIGAAKEAIFILHKSCSIKIIAFSKNFLGVNMRGFNEADVKNKVYDYNFSLYENYKHNKGIIKLIFGDSTS